MAKLMDRLQNQLKNPDTIELGIHFWNGVKLELGNKN